MKKTKETMTLRSFHGSQAVKDKYLSRVRKHRELDNLVQGTRWESGKGCAVGCTLESYDHAAYEKELGLPEWLAHLKDRIFEALPKDDAMEWPESFLEAIPVGITREQFSVVRDRFLKFWLERQKSQIDEEMFPGVASAIDGVISLLDSAISGVEPMEEEWAAAKSAAWSAGRQRSRQRGRRPKCNVIGYWANCIHSNQKGDLMNECLPFHRTSRA